MTQNDAIAHSIVKRPSKMNIHDHPVLPAIPFMLEIAAARRPPRIADGAIRHAHAT